MKALKEQDVSLELKRIPDWEIVDGKLERVYNLGTFPKAIGFVNSISVYSESKNHHPIIELNYNKVKLSLFTWCKEALTQLDFDAASYFDFLYSDEI